MFTTEIVDIPRGCSDGVQPRCTNLLPLARRCSRSRTTTSPRSFFMSTASVFVTRLSGRCLTATMRVPLAEAAPRAPVARTPVAAAPRAPTAAAAEEPRGHAAGAAAALPPPPVPAPTLDVVQRKSGAMPAREAEQEFPSQARPGQDGRNIAQSSKC